MGSVLLKRSRIVFAALCSFTVIAPAAFAGTVTINSPRPSATVPGAVTIAASANEGVPFHIEVWDNGSKLGNFFTNTVQTSSTFSKGAHTLSVLAVSNSGDVLDRSSVNYVVAAAKATGTNPGTNPGTAPGSNAAHGVLIANPVPGSTSANSVAIAASASEAVPFHMEVWDNGRKLGNFFSNALHSSAVLPQGGHTMTILAVSNSGGILDRSVVQYSVSASAGSNPSHPASPPPPPATPSAPPSAPGSTSGSGASGTVAIASPSPGATSISAVTISASANESTPSHLAIWDNGFKLGEVASDSVSGVYVLPNGSHVLTVQAIDNQTGSIIGDSSVNYNVAEDCSNSQSAECDMDQIGINNTQNDCNPGLQSVWVANSCGGGVQGNDGESPQSTGLQAVDEGSVLPDQGNLSLNGKSLHLSETQGSHPSNVLFRGQSPAPVSPQTIDTHWTLDQYVYLPDPTAHQAFEMDTQYTAGGIWTKFYTECAFNIKDATGYWGVFDSETGGWIFLNGQTQNGQTPPVVPCNRSQFSQPWPGSGNPAFSGWHHIAWSYLRNSDGTVTFQSLVFDGTTTEINFTPQSATGGQVNDRGNFSALIQLDGVVNTDRKHDVVDAYVSEVNITHTP